MPLFQIQSNILANVIAAEQTKLKAHTRAQTFPGNHLLMTH